MVDYHSHILPGIDDGSKSVEESIALLEMLKNQGITTVCATPHYYAERRSPESFLERRNAAYERLAAAGSLPVEDIRLGAEVKYFSGISRMENLKSLRLEGTKLLLLEMPFRRWGDSVLSEVAEMSSSGDLILMIAHIERYIDYQPRGTAEALAARGIIIQSNTEHFADKKTRRKALKMLKKGLINAVGSDCHNLEDRAPDFGAFYSAVSDKLGENELRRFCDMSSSILEECK